MPEVRYDSVTVKLIGENVEEFSVIGRVSDEIREVHGDTAADEFFDSALAVESWDGLLAFVHETVHVV